MRAIAALAGALLIVAGAVALITGEFNNAGSWLIVLGLGAAGVAGIITTVASALSG